MFVLIVDIVIIIDTAIDSLYMKNVDFLMSFIKNLPNTNNK